MEGIRTVSLSLPQLASLRFFASSNPSSQVVSFNGRSDGGSQFQIGKTIVCFFFLFFFFENMS